MEEILQKVMQEAKSEMLFSGDAERLDSFGVICSLIPKERKAKAFYLEILAMTTEEKKLEDIKIYHEDLCDFTVEEFNQLIKQCSEKYEGHFEVMIPLKVAQAYGVSEEMTADEEIRLINDIASRNDWEMVYEEQGLGFVILEQL